MFVSITNRFVTFKNGLTWVFLLQFQTFYKLCCFVGKPNELNVYQGT